jgi:heat shock protein HslJ
MRKTLMIMITLAVATACGQEPAEPVGAAPPATENAGKEEETMAANAHELAGDWVLVAIAGEPLEEGLKPPTLTVMPDGTVGGTTGVNRYSGRIDRAEDLLFGPMPTTMMAGTPEAMALENRFTAAMTTATDYELDGDTLTITGEGEELEFERRS